jgi:hypothetical protein
MRGVNEQPRSFFRSRRTWLVAGALATVLAATAVVSIAADTVSGNGTLRRQDRPLAAFTGVELGVPAEVEVRLGSPQSVSIETDENLLALIETRIEDGTLKIQPVRRGLKLKTRQLRIVVTAPEIRALAIGGSGVMRAERLQAATISLDIAGSGTIDVKQLQADSLELEIGGSGSVRLAGTAGRFELEIAGAGEVDAARLKSDQVVVSVAGSGDAVVWAVSALKVSVAGSGDIRYWGDPKTRSSVAGSGNLQRLGAAPL